MHSRGPYEAENAINLRLGLNTFIAALWPHGSEGCRLSFAGQDFATRMQNVFVIGKTDKPLVSLPKGKGIKLSILQEAAKAKASA